MDGEARKLKLKSRLVPRGKRDKDKYEVRVDSSIAQFAVFRLVSSLAVVFNFRTASLDIKSAYLNAGSLERDIYVRPLKSWTPSRQTVLKFLKPTYGKTELDRLWQLVVEWWLQMK